MQTRTNQSNKDELSILGFGCMRFPMKGGSVDEERAKAMIRDAVDKGINYFDTAYIYHKRKSEAVLGNALSGGYREKVKIATKLPPFMVYKIEHAERIFNQQLGALKTDKIDYYLLHMLTDIVVFERMKDLGVLTWMEEKKKAGAIDNIGFSFHGGKKDFEAIVKAYPWDFCQIQYNYLDENNQATKSGLLLAHELGIPVIVMEPLRGGKLAESLPSEVGQAFRRFGRGPAGQESSLGQAAGTASLGQAAGTASPGQAAGAASPGQTVGADSPGQTVGADSPGPAGQTRTPAEWALRWVWNHPEVNVVLSGMSTEGQLAENIKIASDAKANSLTAEELELFREVKALILDKTKVPCTQCRYCMPCPFGVDISGCLSAYNDKFLLGGKNLRLRYMQVFGAMSQKPSNASMCTECGKCLPHCPQQIDIPKELKNVAKELEWPLYNQVTAFARKVLRVRKRNEREPIK